MGELTTKLEKILSNTTFVQGFIMIILIIPLARPLGLPILINQHSMDFYEIIDNLPPDTKILYNYRPTVVLMGDLVPQSIPSMYHLMEKAQEKGLKLYFVGVGFSADGILQLLDSEVWGTIGWPEDYGLKYGEDWCNLGFVAGGDIGYATFAQDVRAAVQYDREGNPIDSLPMMQGINSVDDFDILLNCGEGNAQIVRYWGEPYGKEILLLCLTGAVVQDVEPFYRAGQIKEYLAGVRGAADYELLVNRPGKAVASLDAISVSHVFLLTLFAIGNIIHIVKKYEKGEEK